jgi:hypothetical protein
MDMSDTTASAGYRPDRYASADQIMQTMSELKRKSCVKADLEKCDSCTNVRRMRFTSAAMSGDIPAMRAYLKAMSSPDEPDPWGTTSLSFAVMVGNREGIAELLRMGADPTRRNRSGRSALDCALDARPVAEDILEMLVKAAGVHFGSRAHQEEIS